MNPGSSTLSRLFWLTFAESFSTILLERGVYFFTHDALALTDTANLWLAFAFGAAYALGALSSHPCAERFGERRLLIFDLVALLAAHLLLTLAPTKMVLLGAFPLIGLLQGSKWPLIESFISAGRAPSELVRVLGRFNTTWAIAVPLSLASAGPLIASPFPGSLFALAALINALGVVLAWPLPLRPAHFHDDHPARPTARELARAAALLASARWGLLLSYALLFLLSPLVPTVFAELGLDVREATSAAGILDVARVASFAVLGSITVWRGRALPLLVCTLALPLTFAMVLFSGQLGVVLVGEILFGIASGLIYTASLYYGLLTKNASVDAGGAHEGFIGLGFALGPLAGLAGTATAPKLGGFLAAELAAIAPLVLLCTGYALRTLRAAQRAE